MAVSSRMKNSPEDMAVLDRLWVATQRDVERLAQNYAAAHVVGKRSSPMQDSICAAAKQKGYPIGLIREAGSLIRRDLPNGLGELLEKYRGAIGLSHGGGA